MKGVVLTGMKNNFDLEELFLNKANILFGNPTLMNRSSKKMYYYYLHNTHSIYYVRVTHSRIA